LDIFLIGDALYVLTDIGLGFYDLNKPDIAVESIILVHHRIAADKIIEIDNTKLLLVSKYEYELLDLDNLHYSHKNIEERFVIGIGVS